MLRLNNLKVSIDFDESNLKLAIAKQLRMDVKIINSYKIVKKAIDARDKGKILFIYNLDIEFSKGFDEEKLLKYSFIEKTVKYKYNVMKWDGEKKKSPIIVGAGPAGLFCALILAEAGAKPIVIEQGKDVYSRKKDIEDFIKTGILDVNSNIQFGEGGAGTFSDGKLTTGNKDSRQKKVIQELINCGAPEEIGYLSKPHIGTDNLMGVIENIRKKIEKLGGKVCFQSKLVDIKQHNNIIKSIIIESQEGQKEIETDFLVLAVGHSARETFEMLNRNEISMDAKSFAMGVRIEHTQEFINKSQYGEFYNHKNLGAADYKLVVPLENGRKAYSFCMCPGGLVVPATSEEGQVVVNGMSYFARNETNANSALLITVNPSDFFGEDEENPVLSGIAFQRRLEKKAFEIGLQSGKKYFAPAQRVSDFLIDCKTESFGTVTPSYKPGVTLCDLRDCLDDFMVKGLKEALILMNKKIKGFAENDAVLTAVESRSSSPVRINRNNDFMANIYGIIPCGEGAGFAGGIMSAAVDGIKCAEKITEI